MNDVNQLDPVIDTYHGRLDLRYPVPEQVLLQDVSVALSRVLRYGGHTREPWSVGQHSLLCVDIVEYLLADAYEMSELANDLLMALWHDAAEAYVGDVPRPLKRLLGQAYSQIERPIQAACDQKLVGRKRTMFDHALQTRYDNIAIAAEISTLNGTTWLERAGWTGLPPLNQPVVEYAHARVLEHMLKSPESVCQELEARHWALHADARKTEETAREL